MRYIYQLKDPITLKVVYIGQTGNIEKRYSRHCYEEKHSEPEKNKWIRGLRENGLLPIIEVVELCVHCNPTARENFHILNAIKNGVELFNRNNNKTWKQYDLDGNFIKEFATISIVYKMTGFKPNKRDKKLHDFSWYYDSLGTEKREPYRKMSGIIKTVLQYDANGIFLKEYKGVRQAARENNLTHTCISSFVLGKRNSAGGFIWKYKGVAS